LNSDSLENSDSRAWHSYLSCLRYASFHCHLSREQRLDALRKQHRSHRSKLRRTLESVSNEPETSFGNPGSVKSACEFSRPGLPPVESENAIQLSESPQRLLVFIRSIANPPLLLSSAP
jgi:hypothetical protein